MPESTIASHPTPTKTSQPRELVYELISGASGLILALFMWGHMMLVGTILFGERGFDWLAGGLERLFIAQPTVVVIVIVFLVHAVYASRKIPSRLRERRRFIALTRDLRSAVAKDDEHNASVRTRPHLESYLWVWQVRTGMVILVIGSFHLILLGLDVFTPLFGDVPGIEASTSMERVREGLWLPYAILLLCVEFHAGVGLYRLAIKWGAGSRLSRRTLWRLEHIIFWVFTILGVIILLVLASVLPPPFAFLLD